MEAITAFIDGPGATPEAVVEIHAALATQFPRGVELARPAAPNRSAFAALLTKARFNVAALYGDDPEAEPTAELMSALAKVELLETARLMLCNIERVWCSTAMSRPSARRVNLCTDSELYALMQTISNNDISSECKDVARSICALGIPTNPTVLHIYVGDTDTTDCATYVELANERDLRVATTTTIDGAVAAISAAIQRAEQALSIDAAEFF